MRVTYLPLIILLSAAFLASACDKKSPEKSPATGGSSEEQRIPENLAEIGTTVAALVETWSLTLSQVQTEDDVAAAKERLGLIASQFDALAARAKELPPVSDAGLKAVDRETDALIGKVAGGLEIERRRIFLLPDTIKAEVMPAHENLLKKFRATSRAIQASSRNSR
ncbi:MAG: hypothetical protein ACI8XO_003164 [Verrucomicrobiales bacterium]|jgi:hypothetical protein